MYIYTEVCIKWPSANNTAHQCFVLKLEKGEL